MRMMSDGTGPDGALPTLRSKALPARPKMPRWWLTWSTFMALWLATRVVHGQRVSVIYRAKARDGHGAVV